MTAYGELETRFGRIGRLGGVEGLLHWDTEVMMPRGAASDRAEQLAVLRTVIHELETDAALEDLLARAATEQLDPWQQANLHEMRRRYEHQRAVPAELVAALARAGTECLMVWREARANDDFAALRPRLERVVQLVRERAVVKGQTLDRCPYDALLDEYEPDATAAAIDAVFDDLAAFLPDFTAAVLERQARGPQPLPLEGPFPAAKQRALGLRVMTALGFDFERGRLDTSTHPFCGGFGDDVRITTRYKEDSFAESLMGIIHETGHALYEQGLPAAWRFQPVGQARGMAIHESQSLLTEMQACRSPEFLAWLAPLLGEMFDRRGEAWSAGNLLRHYLRVERQPIRVDADEVTYPAHVILRYRLERAMVADDLQVGDLPGAWAEGMEALVGITPPDDRRGCLQDIHWMDGTFGYFPTYTLGAMSAAQLYEAAVAADAAIPGSLRQGDFRPLVRWLRHHVHARASLVSGEKLLRESTGRPLDATVYRANLRRRYLEG